MFPVLVDFPMLAIGLTRIGTLPGSYGEGEAIAVHNGDVYVAGWYDNGSCYWKMGKKLI